MQTAVLVVDDSLTVRKDLERALLADGYAVTLCGTLEAARTALAQTPFALAILDVILPDGDGIELLKEIKARPETAGLPVILLTTETQVGDRVRGLSIGAGDYVGKPYDLQYVLGRTRELIQASLPAGPAVGPSHILFIDDSLTFREEFKASLESAGYSVVTAGSGEEGLQDAVHRRPALVIVDAQLPGIDGPTVIRRLRMDSALRQVPCLLLTGSIGATTEVAALDSGADAFITKDADFNLILARIAAILRSAESTVPAAQLT
ncbi:MAG TPA: response regulator, partial [Planctomycetota bacterium]|nr:response regulator [Planctomycetota bacterium]